MNVLLSFHFITHFNHINIVAKYPQIHRRYTHRKSNQTGKMRISRMCFHHSLTSVDLTSLILHSLNIISY